MLFNVILRNLSLFYVILSKKKKLFLITIFNYYLEIDFINSETLYETIYVTKIKKYILSSRN